MNKIPKLRFKEFSENWNKEKFGELCGFEQGVQVDVELQHKEPNNDLVKFIRIENYTQNSNDFRFIPKELAKKKSIDEKEIAVVRYGATAGFIGRGFQGVLANNLFKLKPNKKLLDDEYLYHYLKSYKAFHFFQSEMSGGAMPALSFSIVKALKLPYPSKQEQEKIASFLTSVDTKLVQLTKKEKLLQQYKKGVMQKIFSQEIRFIKDDGSEFEEWEEKKLGEIANITIGEFVIKTKQNSNAQYPVYNGGKSNTGFYDEFNNEGNKVIISARGANAGYVNFETERYWAGNSCYSVDMIDKSNNNIHFYFYFIKHFENRFTDYQQAANIPSVSKKDTMEFNVVCPSQEEQNKIANFLSSIDLKIEQVQTQLEQTKEFKKALLQQMFV